MGGPTRLDPDSLWAGPPAWELETLFKKRAARAWDLIHCFLFFFRSGQVGVDL